MKNIAKLIVIDESKNYLMLWRSDHPTYPNDADLPGGIVEADETPEEAVIREVIEEAEVEVDEKDLQKLYEGTEFSPHGNNYHLYTVKLNSRPDIVISWEHQAYKWLSREEFLEEARNAADSYMHMVFAVLNKSIMTK